MKLCILLLSCNTNEEADNRRSNTLDKPRIKIMILVCLALSFALAGYKLIQYRKQLRSACTCFCAILDDGFTVQLFLQLIEYFLFLPHWKLVDFIGNDDKQYTMRFQNLNGFPIEGGQTDDSIDNQHHQPVFHL